MAGTVCAQDFAWSIGADLYWRCLIGRPHRACFGTELQTAVAPRVPNWLCHQGARFGSGADVADDKACFIQLVIEAAPNSCFTHSYALLYCASAANSVAKNQPREWGQVPPSFYLFCRECLLQRPCSAALNAMPSRQTKAKGFFNALQRQFVEQLQE